LPDPNRVAQELFDALPDRYDRLAEVLSFGQNRRWRRAMCDRVVSTRPTLLLDVASGTAGVAIQLARRSGARVVGIDLTEQMLRRGQANVARAAMVGRVSLAVGQAERLPFRDATFDGLSFTYLLRYVADPQATLEELVRVVKPGATVASLEFFVPPNRFWRGWWWLYTRFVLPAGGWLTGGREWWGVGRFLGPSISNHYRAYPLRWHVDAWEKAGLVDVGVRTMSLGGGLVMWGRNHRG
jgi:demethylmenaquinone methyltransferase/2-methoxy-6-polyprenyl-1,4-benzoquinol methylase